MGVLLSIVAMFLVLVLLIPAMLIGTVLSLFEHRGNKYFKDIAISIDQLGNVVCQYLLNIVMITKKGYRFGNPDETISSVFGKNYKYNTLTTFGFFFAITFLNELDENHSVNSIEEDEN